MEAIAKLFAIMTVNEDYDEERAVSPMDWEEEDEEEVLRQQFDSTDGNSSEEDDKGDGDWIPTRAGKGTKAYPTSDRKLRSASASSNAPDVIKGLGSRCRTNPCLPAHQAEAKEGNNVETAFYEGTSSGVGDGSLVDTEVACSVEVQLKLTSANESPQAMWARDAHGFCPKKSTWMQEVAEDTKESLPSPPALAPVVGWSTPNDYELCKAPQQKSREPQMYKGAKMKFEGVCTRAKAAQSRLKQMDNKIRSVSYADAACAPAPSPLKLPRPGSIRTRGPKKATTTAPAPSPFSLCNNAAVLEDCGSKGRNEAQHLPRGNWNQKNQQSGKEKPDPLLDLTPMVKQLMEAELGRLPASKVNRSPASSTMPTKRATPVKCKTNKSSNSNEKAAAKSIPKSKPGNQNNSAGGPNQRGKPKPAACQEADSVNQGITAPSISLNSRRTRVMPKPENACQTVARNKKAPMRGNANPSFGVQKPTLNEVCIVFDNSNVTMEKFLTVLGWNLEKFWDLACSAEGSTRISVVTPSQKLDFTTNKEDFLLFCDDAVKSKVADCDDELSVIEGLAQSMPRLEQLSWTRGSAGYTYIFTSLAGCDGDDKALRWKLCARLYALTSHIPLGTDIMVGSWMRDNSILEEALIHANRHHKTFPLLNLKGMASFVVHEKDLLQVMLASLASNTERKTKICFAEGLKRQHAGFESNFMDPKLFFTSEATMLAMKPLSSIQEVLSNAMPSLNRQAVWMKRTIARHESYDELYCLGRLGIDKGKWKQDVMLKSLKLDEINRKKGPGSEEYHKNRAYVAAVANFFASKYNEEHRPEACARIKFLDGCVVERVCENGQLHVFYAEERLSIWGGTAKLKFTEFCDKAGQWDESVVDESLLRFVLTCFKLSGGDLLLSGLTGTRMGNELVLRGPTLLSKKSGNAHTGECTKEYMKHFRKNTKALMDKRGWNSKKMAVERPAKFAQASKSGRNGERKCCFVGLLNY